MLGVNSRMLINDLAWSGLERTLFFFPDLRRSRQTDKKIDKTRTKMSKMFRQALLNSFFTFSKIFK